MPELPEVETIAKGVDALIRGDRIRDAWFSSKREPMKTAPQIMARALTGKRIERVHRAGKHIVFELDAGKAGSRGRYVEWIVHLGMTGRLLVTASAAPIAPHTHCTLTLASGRELRFVDPRRFGRLSLHRGSAPDDSFHIAGREPLTTDAETFAGLFRGRRTPIKAALLNQKLLSGVGNIYADESLFRAGIRPRRAAFRLTRAELEQLRRSLQEVLREAIARGGSSISDYLNAAGEPGLFQLEHMVYARTDQPCRQCGTTIRRIVVAGRGTHYCPHCQK